MKTFTPIFTAAILLLCATAQAQLKYRDASAFPLYGKIGDASECRYARFPDSLEHISRAALWDLSRNSAGMAVRFSTDSPAIAAKWTTQTNFGMNHMTDTGIRGLDLYALIDGQWRFVNTARPSEQRESHAVIIDNMDAAEREYMLYLPLYAGLTSLEIGVDSLSFLRGPATDLPVRSKPIVFYGTSILQGGCASRPGMAFTNIISRRMNRETINLGFSGNAFLDYEVAELMSAVDAGCFVLDFAPNASPAQILEKAERFYRIIREKHMKAPVIFVEDPIFPTSAYNCRLAQEVKNKNEALRTVFDKLTAMGETDIHYVSSEKMIGDDGEATVDGIHFTDIGMVRYSDLLCPIIQDLTAD